MLVPLLKVLVPVISNIYEVMSKKKITHIIILLNIFKTSQHSNLSGWKYCPHHQSKTTARSIEADNMHFSTGRSQIAGTEFC